MYISGENRCKFPAVGLLQSNDDFGTLRVDALYEETHENWTLTTWNCGKIMHYCIAFTSLECTMHIGIISFPVFDSIVEPT